MAAPVEVFKSFSLEQLQKIAKHERIPEREIDLDLSKKSAVVKAISKEATENGVRQLVSLFKLASLKDICEPLDLDMEGKNANSKSVYQKRLKEKMMELGVSEFLEEYMDEKRLKLFIDVLGEKPDSDKKAELVEQATRLINFTGVSTFLSTFETGFLQDLMSEMKLKCKTDNKMIILEAIASQTDAKADPNSRNPHDIPAFSKTKLAIKKGITFQDIFQHYNLDELVDYCRENELKVSGPKPKVIQRILDFLDGDLENTKAVNKTEKKEKSEKKETKEVSKKKTEKKKEEKKVDEDEEASEEDEKKVEEKVEKKESSKKSIEKKESAKKTEEKEKEKEKEKTEVVSEEEESEKDKKAKKGTKKSGSKKN